MAPGPAPSDTKYLANQVQRRVPMAARCRPGGSAAGGSCGEQVSPCNPGAVAAAAAEATAVKPPRAPRLRLSGAWAGRVGPRRHWAAMMSEPGQRATAGPAERGGASPRGTAPGARLGARGRLRLVPGPRHQGPRVGRRVPPVGDWDSAHAQVPGRGKVTHGGRTRTPSGPQGASGRKRLRPGRGPKGSPASTADAVTHRARTGGAGGGLCAPRPPVST